MVDVTTILTETESQVSGGNATTDTDDANTDNNQ